MRILILGAGGVFGQNFAQAAKDAGHDVLGIGRSPRKPAPYSLTTDFRYVELHAEDAIPLCANHDVVVNFAAQAGLVPQSWQYPRAFYMTNTLLPVRLAEVLPKSCHLIHIGSSEVYGSVTAPASEDAPIRPSSPYAVSKAAADMHLMTLHDERITVVRPSNCYSPGQSLHRLIPRAVLACIGGPRMQLQGNAQKSYMHADDLSRALLMLAESRTPGMFNCGVSLPISIGKVVEGVAAQFGKTTADIADVTEGRAHEDGCFWVSSEKMLRMGWEPRISLDDGLSHMARWGERYREQLLSMPIDYKFMA